MIGVRRSGLVWRELGVPGESVKIQIFAWTALRRARAVREEGRDLGAAKRAAGRLGLNALRGSVREMNIRMNPVALMIEGSEHGAVRMDSGPNGHSVMILIFA